MTVVERLIQKGADLSAVDRVSYLQVVHESLCYFIQSVCSQTQNGECCLHFTETLRNIHLLEMLVKEYKRAKVSVDLPSQVSCLLGNRFSRCTSV